MTDRKVLRLLCGELSDQGHQVKLLWDTNAAVPPLPALEDNAQAEENRDGILDMEGEGILRRASSEVLIDQMKPRSGTEFENQR